MVKITYIGHAAVLIEGSKKVLIDPFIAGNPKAGMTVAQVPKVDFVLVTHDHPDHVGDAVEIAKRDDATFVAGYELATSKTVVDSGINAVGMGIGGTYAQDGVVIHMTQAVHSAATGSAAGFVVAIDGHTIYHAGDTALFSDMALIRELWGPLDVALLPIGGHFVMDARQATLAVGYLKPKVVIPIHYNTWPPIAADPSAFKKECTQADVEILEPGQSYTLA